MSKEGLFQGFLWHCLSLRNVSAHLHSGLFFASCRRNKHSALHTLKRNNADIQTHAWWHTPSPSCVASLQIYSGLTFFLGKVALEKVSLFANTRKGGHFETLGKRLFIGPLALATFLLTFAQDAFLLHQTHKYKIQIQMQRHTHSYKSKR